MTSILKPQFLKISAIILAASVLFSCEEDAPGKEDTPELITKIQLTFTPAGGGNPIVATATDPDGIGVQDIAPDGQINLIGGTNYRLSIEFFNGLLSPTEAGYDITEEVLEEANEHMLFFSWDGGFSNPTGNGNIDNRTDPVRYADNDSKGLPLGLLTDWSTQATATQNRKFRIMLKHQPDLKSASSGSNVGETDVDIQFTFNVTAVN